MTALADYSEVAFRRDQDLIRINVLRIILGIKYHNKIISLV